MWATFGLFGRKMRIGAPKLLIDLKLRVTRTKNWCERRIINAAHPYITPQCDCPLPPKCRINLVLETIKKYHLINHKIRRRSFEGGSVCYSTRLTSLDYCLFPIVGGNFIFDEADITLHSEYILITDQGVLQVGTQEEPFKHKAIIELHGHVRSKELPIYGAKVLAVRNGTLELHGKVTGLFQWLFYYFKKNSYVGIVKYLLVLWWSTNQMAWCAYNVPLLLGLWYFWHQFKPLSPGPRGGGTQDFFG